MTRGERVLEYIEKAEAQNASDFQGADASTVAAALRIWRSDASTELNRLCDLGLLAKSGRKPVFYRSAKGCEARACLEAENGGTEASGGQEAPRRAASNSIRKPPAAFETLVGNGGSLKAQVKIAKAAVLYPPHGLHTLIIGETGVGKSLFAEEMWKFASEACRKDREAIPYVVFNCAEYADNPQLLVSQLFGHAKGAFTGADQRKEGLVEKARGGILFLDEIHRLPPAGQEMFFMLLDRGCYRMLGDGTDRKADVMIVGATSENPSSALLATFKRRMPVLIHIPNIAERSPHERVSLIRLFLIKEADRLRSPIHLSGRALKVLASYRPKANIGDLRSDLQLCCAHSYLGYKMAEPLDDGQLKQDRLSIDIYDLPQKIYLSAESMDEGMGEYIRKDLLDGLLVHPGDEAVPLKPRIVEGASPDIFKYVEKAHSCPRRDLPEAELEKLAGIDLEQYWDEAQAILSRGDQNEECVFWDIVAPAVWDISGRLLLGAKEALNRLYPASVRRSLALHLQQFVERVNSGQIVYNPNILYIKSNYPSELAYIRKAAPELRNALGVQITEDELCFLCLFLKGASKELLTRRVGLVIAAHGKSVATGMADFVNQVLCTNKVRAVDAPLDSDRTELLSRMAHAVREVDEGQGVLVLADMGSFVSMRDELVEASGVQCIVLQNVSSSLALEAGRIALSTELPLAEAYGRLIECAGKQYACVVEAGSAPSQPRAMDAVEPNRPALLIVCATGRGSAEKIRQTVVERIPRLSEMEIQTLGLLEDVEGRAAGLGDRLKLIIGTIDPDVPGVPFMNAASILGEKGIAALDRFLDGTGAFEAPPAASREGEDLIEAFCANIERFVRDIPGELALKASKRAIRRIEAEVLRRRFTVDERIRAYMHIVALLDRLARGEVVEASFQDDAARDSNPALYGAVGDIMNEACLPFGFDFPASEAYYMILSTVGCVPADYKASCA